MPTTSVRRWISLFSRSCGFRADLRPVLDGERREGQDVVGVEEVHGDVVEPGLGEPVDDVAQLVPGGVRSGCSKIDRTMAAIIGYDAFGTLPARVGHEMGSTPLPAGATEHLGDRRLDPAVSV